MRDRPLNSEISTRGDAGSNAAPTGPDPGDAGWVVDAPSLVHDRDDDPFYGPPLETAYCAFTPRRLGIYGERFGTLAATLGHVTEAGHALIQIESAFRWASAQHGAVHARDRFRAAASVLADLIGQGWSWRYRDYQLELAPPDFTTPARTPTAISRQKEAIRASMATERAAQFQVPSSRRFIAELEQPRRHRGRDLSILSLVANGEDLARDLRAAAALAPDDRQEALHQVVRPVLQLIEGDARCELTGYRLMDIWRYFRYFWSLPYFSTPGRNLFYLIRDEARPLHPVLGLAALGNSMVRLADRERWIGWTVDSVEQAVRAHSADETAIATLARSLYGAIERGLDDIDADGLVTKRDVANPSDRVLLKLADRARTSAQQRVAHLRTHAEDLKLSASKGTAKRPTRPRSGTLAGPPTAADLSVEHLYEQKRATDIAELLRAKRAFLAVDIARDPARALQHLLDDDDGRRAVATSIKSTKKQHIGTSMMDIIICGSIPPYSHVLGGKLVCMLLASPEVRLDYRRRYAEAPSEIASRMKGVDVAKPAELVFLGTTSLYHVGSSQYNRVRIPADVVGASGGEVRYLRLGATRGYGSVHYSDRTRVLLEHIVHNEKGVTLITRTFGEGVNPKLRLVREGLSSIGVDQDRFLQHQCRRIIYGVPLAANTQQYLRGEATTPEFVLPAGTHDEARKASRAIADYWTRRWLSPRVGSIDVLDRVAHCRPTELQMSAVFASVPSSSDTSPDAPTGAGAQSSAAPGTGGPILPPPSDGPLGVAFVQRLYNHRSCYADRLSPEQLDAIHVKTALETFIEGTLRAGRDIVLTGNPGDGKTHLIMRLQPTLKALGVEFHADATAEESSDTIVAMWQAARKRKRPFCLAINEWPLLELLRDQQGRFQALAEVRDQVERGIVYDDAPASSRTIVVIDLNNRNIVDSQVFDGLISTLTSERFYPECPRCPARETCDVPRARVALRSERVRGRLFDLIELVTKRGHHVTMRDLQGFVAFLLTGGRDCTRLIADQEPHPYSSLAFEGESDLFDAIRAAFDPARVTHPIYDEALWAGTLPTEGWLPGAIPAPPPPAAAPGDPLAAMRAVKRRFFFEHAEGGRLFQLLPEDERRFLEALAAAPQQGEMVVRQLVRLINRFFDPREGADDALRLWTRHCYDARWSPTYVSVRAIPAASLAVRAPRLNATVAKAYAFRPDHLLLAATSREGRTVATLTADLTLYRTLFDAQRGLPMALRSPEVLKRLDLFFNALGRAFRATRDIEDVHVKNFETGEDLRFKVDRHARRFSL